MFFQKADPFLNFSEQFHKELISKTRESKDTRMWGVARHFLDWQLSAISKSMRCLESGETKQGFQSTDKPSINYRHTCKDLLDAMVM